MGEGMTVQEAITRGLHPDPSGAASDFGSAPLGTSSAEAAALRDLADARTARMRLETLPRRSLTLPVQVLLWGLRLYVLGMIGALVIHAVFTL